MFPRENAGTLVVEGSRALEDSDIVAETFENDTMEKTCQGAANLAKGPRSVGEGTSW